MNTKIFRQYLLLACQLILAYLVTPSHVRSEVRAEKIVKFCRDEVVSHLKHKRTLEWTDRAKQEGSGTWLVSRVRSAKSPNGPEGQTFTCRVLEKNENLSIKMISLFGESTRSGKDIFRLY